MQFEVKQATRELIYVKIALIAPSGGGKTYSGLRLATGMLDKLKELGLEGNGRILMGNTEGPRGLYYADEFEYDIVNLAAPHNPEMYVDFITWAEEQGYPILLLDSASHEWEGKGGCLELHQLAGGNYQSWGKITPRHNEFIYRLADSRLHVIATMRGKDQYEMDKSETGRITVRKLGVGAQQRNNVEYEFTSTFLIDQVTNLAVTQKDNTHLFESLGNVKLNETHGKQLIEWANSGEGFTVPVREVKSAAEILQETIAEKQKEVISELNRLGGSKGPKGDELKALLKKGGSVNPNKITKVDALDSILEVLKTWELEEEVTE